MFSTKLNQTTEFCIQGLFLFVLTTILYQAREVFVPITIALMLQFVLRPFVKTLERIKIPRKLGSAIVLLGFIILFSLAASQLVEPAQRWYLRFPASISSIETYVTELKASFRQVSRAAERIEGLTAIGEAPSTVVVKSSSLLDSVLSSGQKIMIQTVLVLLLTFFLLAYGSSLGAQIVSYLENERKFTGSIELFHQIEFSITRYLSTIVAIYLLLGFTISVALYLIGVPNPLLWGAMGAVLKFVPYVGVLFGALIMGLVGVVSFDEPWRIIAAPLVFYGLSAIEGNIVTPLVLGRRFLINPILIFCWLIFCFWIWGVPGAFLAVPLLISGKITMSHIWRQRLNVTDEELRNIPTVIHDEQ